MRRLILGIALAAIAASALAVTAWAGAAQLGGARATASDRGSAESVYESGLGEGVVELEAIGGGSEEGDATGEKKGVRRDSTIAESESESESEAAAQATETEAGEEEASGALSSLNLGDGASTLEELEIPTALLPVYQACGTRYGISWEVLAAINKVETGFGTNLGTSSAGAEGWMQFLPSSWKEWGTDADGDGKADTDDPVDAICSAARYLAASGGESDIYDAVLAYNHADWYAREVLADARRYERVPVNLVNSLTALAAGSTYPVAGSTNSWNGTAAAEALSGDRATIAGKAGADVLAVVEGTVEKVGEGGALGRYVVLGDAYGDRFVYSDLGKVTVEAGDEVAEGDVLGSVGESAIGFAARPDAAETVDPTELLELWQRGGTGAVYAVEDEGASAGSKSVRSLLMSAAVLRREVLADENLELPACVRAAVRDGELRRQGLAALEYLSGRGYQLGVAASTCESADGFKVAIDSVDGKSVEAGQGSGTSAYALAETVVGMDAATAPQTVSSRTGIAAAETGGSSAATIELDYRPPEKARIVDGDAVAPTDAPAAVQAMIAAANQIDETPYVWGGGHGAWVSAGYDCSGSVSYVLHAAKMLSSPQTSGALEGWGESGTGRWVTVYANADHTYAVIAGLRWDTVGDATGSGPRWHDAAAYPEGFTVRHPAGL
ncbi:MAG: lytic murein transglycosylase [Actinobacteria bacterium]|nr:lytic murein transglycosylase [Actinomycetota bacterium]